MALAVGVALFAARGLDAAPAKAPDKVVLVAPIEGVIDLGLAPMVERVLSAASEMDGAVVVLKLETFGGRVDAAVAIRDHLLRSPVRTIAFVDKRAISAGALIALASKEIAVAQGATIGAATPVQFTPDQGTKPTDEKTVSYLRKEFRATADVRGRPGRIAEAMVDADVEIPGVIAKGKLLTLTTDEALEHGVAQYRAHDLPALLEQLGLAGAEVRRVEPNWAERVVRFLTNPVVASLLMSLGVLGLLVELRTPGFGIPGLVGILSLAAFFWGHWLVELVGWEQVLLVGAGVVLLALELFVVPGFGVVGLLGIVALAAGLSSSLFGTGASPGAILAAVSQVAISCVIAIAAGAVVMRLLPHLPGGRKLVLHSELEGTQAALEGRGPLQGVVGTTLTPLRPAGIALISGRRVDVVSQGEYLSAGETIEVVRDEIDRVIVRRTASIEPSGGSA